MMRGFLRLAVPCLSVALSGLGSTLEARMLQQQTSAPLEPTRHEQAFVKRLDRAWSNGNGKRVVRLFRFRHKAAERMLVDRLANQLDGTKRSRRSEIRQVFEVAAARGKGQRFRALFLQADVQRAPPAPDERYFEVLVFGPDPRDGKQSALLLIQSTLDAQQRVRPRSAGVGGGTGNPIGNDLSVRCKACKWIAGVPPSGLWAVFARPPEFIGCLEGLEVFSLIDDLTMSFMIVPDCEVPRPLEELVRTSIAEHAERLGYRTHKSPRMRSTTKVGLAGQAGTLTTPGRAGRAFVVHAYRCGPIVYFLSFETRARELDRLQPHIHQLVDAFVITDPETPPDHDLVLKAHGGPGDFTSDKREFRVAELGLAVRSPGPGWTSTRRVSPYSFHAGWLSGDRPGRKKSSLNIIGWSRCTSDWRGSSQETVRSWVRWQFRPRTTHAQMVEIGAKNAALVWFETKNKAGRTKGFALGIPCSNVLVLLVGVAPPGKDQDCDLQQMRQAALGVQVQ